MLSVVPDRRCIVPDRGCVLTALQAASPTVLKRYQELAQLEIAAKRKGCQGRRLELPGHRRAVRWCLCLGLAFARHLGPAASTKIRCVVWKPSHSQRHPSSSCYVLKSSLAGLVHI